MSRKRRRRRRRPRVLVFRLDDVDGLLSESERMALQRKPEATHISVSEGAEQEYSKRDWRDNGSQSEQPDCWKLHRQTQYRPA